MKALLGLFGVALLGLTACGGGGEQATIAKLDSTMMVFIEPPVRKGGQADAVVHYVFAKPEPMDREQRATRMMQRFVFDCTQGRVAERVQKLTLESGRVITSEFAGLDFKDPKPRTLLAGIRDNVCDPAKVKAHRAPISDLAAAEKRYRRMLADGKL